MKGGIALALSLCLFFMACGNTTPVQQKTTTPYYGPEVVYEIIGTAEKVDVTLNNSSGGTEQYDNVLLPKNYTYYTFNDWFLYISAQNQGEYGTVRVTIYYNGEIYKTSSSSGAYVIASASGAKP